MSSTIRATLSKGEGSSPFYIEGIPTPKGGRLVIKQGNLIIELLIEGDKHIYFTKIALSRAFNAIFKEESHVVEDTKKEVSRNTGEPCSTAQQGVTG